MNIGWLINDQLSCIPGTKTFWHDLLENIPNLIDQTDGYTDFSILPDKIEKLYLAANNKPNYIIRNATYFRKINIECKTISLLQDVRYDLFQQQIDVCNNSHITVFNSKYIYDIYNEHIQSKKIIIPLGVDFDFFKPIEIAPQIKSNYKIKENTILYIGSSNIETKGFNIILDLINNTNHNFCLVMKDDFKINHERVMVFNQISHEELRIIINCCKLLVCASNFETLHLAGIEAAGCNIPIVSTNVGIYYELNNHIKWGEVAFSLQDFIQKIDYIINNYQLYSPRKAMIDQKLDKVSCMNTWKAIINE